MTILEAAKKLKNDDRFVFSIIGEGDVYKRQDKHCVSLFYMMPSKKGYLSPLPAPLPG